MKLERFFKSTHGEAWAAFAQDVGGRLSETPSMHQPVVEVGHARGTIRIEGHVTMVLIGKTPMPIVMTRFSVPLASSREQRFSVSRASFGSAIASWFGALDIQVDDPEFDAEFVLKGETPDIVRALFADASLRARYLRDFDGKLHRHDDASMLGDPTPDADPFVLDVPGLVQDTAKLRALYDLFVATLDRLD